MTVLLERAFREVAKLSEQEQNAFANWILQELASDERWDRAFAESQSQLERLADEALAEHHAGRTMPLDPAKL